MADPGRSDPGHSESGPKPLGASLDHVTRALGMPPATVLETVFSQWSDLVGAPFTAHAQPASLRGEVLVVSVDDPAWATELRYRAHDLLSRMAGRIGHGSPTRIEVRVRPQVPGDRSARW